MTVLTGDALLWWRFGHFIGVVCWMAGLFYLPRLFVYHMENNEEMANVFQKMEKRLYKYIILPSSLITWICGIVLVIAKEAWLHTYFYLKLFCLVILTFFQFSLERYRILLTKERRPAILFRFINEIPTVLLLIIVYCAVFKPFK